MTTTHFAKMAIYISYLVNIDVGVADRQEVDLDFFDLAERHQH